MRVVVLGVDAGAEHLAWVIERSVGAVEVILVDPAHNDVGSSSGFVCARTGYFHPGLASGDIVCNTAIFEPGRLEQIARSSVGAGAHYIDTNPDGEAARARLEKVGVDDLAATAGLVVLPGIRFVPAVTALLTRWGRMSLDNAEPVVSGSGLGGLSWSQSSDLIVAASADPTLLVPAPAVYLGQSNATWWVGIAGTVGGSLTQLTFEVDGYSCRADPFVAAAAVAQIVDGEIAEVGVLSPEDCFDPEGFTLGVLESAGCGLRRWTAELSEIL